MTPPIVMAADGPIATILLNRPEKRNALSRPLIAALKQQLRAVDEDDAVRVIALRGAGKDFCSGMDLEDLRGVREMSLAENLADVDSLAELFLLLRRLRKPVVALVHGRALAGGCGLATACDLVLATESATFGYSEVKIGFVPAIVAAILRRNVTEKRAFEMMALGESFPAREAERVGLVNRVFPDDEFEARAGALLVELASRSGLAVELCKRTLYQQDGLGFDAAVRAGADVNLLARTSEELKRGVERFLAGKPARPEG